MPRLGHLEVIPRNELLTTLARSRLRGHRDGCPPSPFPGCRQPWSCRLVRPAGHCHAIWLDCLTLDQKAIRSHGTFHRSCDIIRIAQYSGSFSDSCRVWLVDIFASCARGHVLAYGLGTLGQTSPRSYSDGSNFFSPTGSSGHRDWSSGNSRRDWRHAVESGAFRRVGINVHATGSLPSKRPCIATTTDDCRSAGGGPASSITPANRVLDGDNRSFCCW